MRGKENKVKQGNRMNQKFPKVKKRIKELMKDLKENQKIIDDEMKLKELRISKTIKKT